MKQFDLRGDPRRLLRRKRLIERRQGMRIEIVAHQRDPLDLGVPRLVDEPTNLMRPVDGRFGRRDGDVPPGPQRLDEHPHIGHSFPDVLVVDPCRTPWRRWNRRAPFGDQLLRLFVHANHGTPRIIGPFVDVQDLFHLANERRVLLGRDAPHLFSPRFERAFFKTRRTVSWDTVSTISNSTARRDMSRSDHRAKPSGGCEQASLVSWASCSPSTFVACVVCGLRSSNDSGPDSTACFRQFSKLRVVPPKASTIRASGQPGPLGPWSHLRSALSPSQFPFGSLVLPNQLLQLRTLFPR